MIWSSDHLFICQWCWYESHHLLLRWFFSVIFHVRLFYIETSLRLHNSPPHLFCSQFLTIPILALWTFYIHLMNRVKCRDQAIVDVWFFDILTLLNSILGYGHERNCFFQCLKITFSNAWFIHTLDILKIFRHIAIVIYNKLLNTHIFLIAVRR